MSELEAAAAVEAMSMEVDSDEEVASADHFNEHTGNITPRPVKQDMSVDKENESMNPTENGEQVSDFLAIFHPVKRHVLAQPTHVISSHSLSLSLCRSATAFITV